jgi:hypothetical protein
VVPNNEHDIRKVHLQHRSDRLSCKSRACRACPSDLGLDFQLFDSCSFPLSKHLPCPIRFRSTCSSSRRPSRCRRSCIPPYRRIQNSSVQRASSPRARRCQRCACIYSDKSQLSSKATNRRVDSQLARVPCAPFLLVLRHRPYYALNLWNMDSARSTTRGKYARILKLQRASLV